MKAQEIIKLITERLEMYQRMTEDEHNKYLKENDIDKRHKLKIMQARYNGAEVAIESILRTIKIIEKIDKTQKTQKKHN